MEAVVCLLAVLMDMWLGEPKRFHPLVGFGLLAGVVEKWFYGAHDIGALARKIRGTIGVFILIVPLMALLYLLLQWEAGSVFLEVLVLYLAIGMTSLEQHARAVALALMNGNIELARTNVAKIVSRDCRELDASQAAKATIESVLENGSDGIFGAIFWYLVLGAPGVLMYRLANTLDAMWGYRNSRYQDFGWAAARFDDLVNWVPARLTALSYALLGNTAGALACWKAQSRQWESRNAGAVLASGAGALTLCLGGVAYYQGKIHKRPLLGEGPIPETRDIGRAMLLVKNGVLLWLGVIVITASSIHYFHQT